jgi:hypothetical protein
MAQRTSGSPWVKRIRFALIRRGSAGCCDDTSGRGRHCRCLGSISKVRSSGSVHWGVQEGSRIGPAHESGTQGMNSKKKIFNRGTIDSAKVGRHRHGSDECGNSYHERASGVRSGQQWRGIDSHHSPHQRHGAQLHPSFVMKRSSLSRTLVGVQDEVVC